MCVTYLKACCVVSKQVCPAKLTLQIKESEEKKRIRIEHVHCLMFCLKSTEMLMGTGTKVPVQSYFSTEEIGASNSWGQSYATQAYRIQPLAKCNHVRVGESFAGELRHQEHAVRFSSEKFLRQRFIPHTSWNDSSLVLPISAQSEAGSSCQKK